MDNLLKGQLEKLISKQLARKYVTHNELLVSRRFSSKKCPTITVVSLFS